MLLNIRFVYFLTVVLPLLALIQESTTFHARSGEKPIIIGLIARCGTQQAKVNPMGKMMSGRLNIFSRTILRNYFYYHEFDVCENESLLVVVLTSMLLENQYTDVNNKTLVKSIITFIPEPLVKLTFDILSFTKIKIWPLQSISDMKYFEDSPRFLPVHELLPKDFISPMISKHFNWDNVNIVEVLMHIHSTPIFELDNLWRQVSGKKCISYSQVQLSMLYGKNKKMKQLLKKLESADNPQVVFVVGKMAALFMDYVHSYGIRKYWVIFSNYVGTNSTDGPNFISVMNSGIEHTSIKVSYSPSNNYTQNELDIALKLVPKRLLDIKKNEIEHGDYQELQLAQHQDGRTMIINSINKINITQEIARISTQSKCSTCVRCKQECEVTAIKNIDGGIFNKRYGYTCQKCKRQYIKEKYGACVLCTGRTVPTTNQTACYDPIKNIPVSIVCYILTAVGFLLSLFTLVLYIVYRNTPVVKSSNFQLSIVQLVSCLLYYGAFICLLMVEPTDFVCTLRPIIFSTLLVSIVAIVVCKAEKILIIFFKRTRLSKKDIKDISIRQLFIFGFLITVNFILIPASLKIPASVIRVPYTMLDGNAYSILCCSSDEKFYIQLIYGVAILLLAIAQGYRGRKLPTNYNEGISIIVASALTASALILCIWAINSRRHRFNMLEMVWITLSVALISMVVCLYGPKIYIIIFQASKNTKIYHMQMMLVDAQKQAVKETLVHRKRSGSQINVKLNIMITKSQDSFYG